MKIMKNKTFCCRLQSGMLCGALLMVCASAKAISYGISFDGNGDISGNTANAFPTVGAGNPSPIYTGVGPDNGVADLGPFSGNTVSYSTETPNGMDVSGDLYIYCDPAHTELMVILRFYAVGQQYIFVYSETGGTALADNGFTSTLLGNVAGDGLAHLSVTAEDIGGYAGYIYTPTAGEPAYGGDITFTFTSDDLYGNWSVSDAASSFGLLLAGLGTLALFGSKWSRQSARASNQKTQALASQGRQV